MNKKSEKGGNGLGSAKQIYFKNGYILTMNESNQVYENGSLLVQDDKILAAGKVEPGPVSYTHLDVYKRQGPYWGFRWPGT